ncbi:MAG: TonB-dependent receptor [Bacteroidetes bacterium]|nr:TonB-dependent receptor [Bacteroidota bacterium]
MKRIFFICTMIFICHLANAQNKLTGRITDKLSGETIPGATIYIPELKTGAISDINGNYKINNLPKTKIILQISFVGYKSIVENVNLAKTAFLNFAMEQAITEMNEVVVTGTSKATEITRNPVPMITLNRKELQRNLSTNIIDAISRLPGVSAISTGPNVSKPIIHGLGFNRVLTLFDGVRQEGQQWGDEHGVEMDENAVDRIEIVKGPASLTYGSDALAGVVNLLPALPVTDGKIQGHMVSNYQTNNGLYKASATLAGNTNGFIWGGVVSHQQATNYQNKYDGRVYGTAFNETDLSGYVGLNKQWGYSHLNFSMFDDLQEIPDGSRDSSTRRFTKQITENDLFRPVVSDVELNSYKIATLHQHVQHYKLYSSNNFIFGESKLGLVLGYQQNIRQEFSHPENPEIAGLYLVLNTFTYDTKYYLPEYKGWETTIGLNGMYQKNENKGTEFIIPDYHLFDIGPFAFVQKVFDKLEVSGGFRYDMRVFNNNAMYTRTNPQSGFDMQANSPDGADQPFYSFKHTFSGMSGSIGATYKISDKLFLKGNIARGFRSPNIAEISANGIHPGTLIYQIGNTGFRPEFSLQEDFGISYRSDHISGNLDLFNNQISNYIFNEKLLNHLGQDSIIVRGNQTYKFQQAEAQLYGWEASLDIHPFDWLHFENSLSVVYALNKGGNGIQVTDSSKYLPFIPPLHTNSELRANIKSKNKYVRSLYLKIGMEYYAKQERIYAADNTESPTSGYILYNAGIGADITNGQGKVLVNIDILGNNITDVAYQSHLSRLKYFEEYPNSRSARNGIYNMGSNISFKVTVPLNFK